MRVGFRSSTIICPKTTLGPPSVGYSRASKPFSARSRRTNAAVSGCALSDVLGRVEADAEKALETLKEYCRFPTISAHKRAQAETAAFVRRLLAENGFEAREYPTDGGPNVVFGQMIVDERKPTLMMYQHYDVQPVDPLNEWKRDPFDPTIQDGKFWGRGCGDTKGNLIMQ